MISFVTILIILACVVLAFFVLIQNPKGGGLSGSFGSLGNQVMGVKQSTDVMEKGTWSSMAIIAALCLVSVTFYTMPKEVKDMQKQKTGAPAQQQQQQAPAQAPAGGGK